MIVFDNGMDADICGCNYRCVACNHFAPFGNIPLMQPSELEHDLEILAKFVHMKRMSILGGEPTLHPDIVLMLQIAKASGIGDIVELTTNASRLHLMPPHFWEIPDVIYISIYDAKPQWENIKLARQKAKDYGFEVKVKRHEFFKVMTKEPVSETVAQRHYNTCVLRQICHATYHGYFYQCPASKIIPGRFMGLEPTVDGIPIDRHLTEDKVREFLGRKEHLNACFRCSQQQVPIDWREATDLDDWLEGSAE